MVVPRRTARARNCFYTNWLNARQRVRRADLAVKVHKRASDVIDFLKLGACPRTSWPATCPAARKSFWSLGAP